MVKSEAAAARYVLHTGVCMCVVLLRRRSTTQVFTVRV